MKSNDTMTAVTSCLGGIVGLVALLFFGALVKGWAVATLWNWYIVRITVNGAHPDPLNYVVAYGLALFVGLIALHADSFRTDDKRSEEQKRTDSIMAWMLAFVTPAWFVLLGWVVLHFL